MRYLCCLLVLAGLPSLAAAQHTSSLPALGGPLPRIGLKPSPLPVLQSTPWWERRQTPWWEQKNPPPWERGHVSERDLRERQDVIHRRRDRNAAVVYVPYPVYPVYYEPQPIVVAQPPEVVTRLTERQREEIADEIERIVEDRIKAYRDSVSAEPPARTEPAPPPPAPTGSKTLYMIPGCYMGNVSPKDMKLPAGCDLGKLVIVTP